MNFKQRVTRELLVWKQSLNVSNEVEASQYGIDNGEGSPRFPGLNASYIRYCLLKEATEPKKVSKTIIRRTLKDIPIVVLEVIKQGCLLLPDMEFNLPRSPQLEGWDIFQCAPVRWVQADGNVLPNYFIYLALWELDATFPGDLGLFYCVMDVECIKKVLRGIPVENPIGAIPEPGHLKTLLQFETLLG